MRALVMPYESLCNVGAAPPDEQKPIHRYREGPAQPQGGGGSWERGWGKPGTPGPRFWENRLFLALSGPRNQVVLLP